MIAGASPTAIKPPIEPTMAPTSEPRLASPMRGLVDFGLVGFKEILRSIVFSRGRKGLQIICARQLDDVAGTPRLLPLVDRQHARDQLNFVAEAVEHQRAREERRVHEQALAERQRVRN